MKDNKDFLRISIGVKSIQIRIIETKFTCLANIFQYNNIDIKFLRSHHKLETRRFRFRNYRFFFQIKILINLILTLKNFIGGFKLDTCKKCLSSLPTGGLYTQSRAFIKAFNPEAPPFGSLSKYCKSFTSGTAPSFA